MSGSSNERPVTDAAPGASAFVLPDGPWPTLLDALCANFRTVPAATWRARFERGRILGDDGAPLDADMPARRGLRVHYFREVADEAHIPFDETVVHADEHLVVADKPHFLPVVPSGRFVEETLLRRLVRRFGNPHLVPLHRLDRDTAGLVLFSADPATRSRYQALFRERAIDKRYEAVAPALPDRAFPLIHRSRLDAGEPFFRMREVDGEANSETRIDVIARDGPLWHYALTAVTGRKHQLRVHMAALGAPIANDRWYPQLLDEAADDPARPLRLLARSLAFRDPLDGRLRCFESPRAV